MNFPEIPAKWIALAVLLIIIFSPIGFSYSGFCPSEMRFVSDEEKVRNVIFWHLTGSKVGARYDDDGIVEEFLEKYPDCCRLGPEGYEGDKYYYVDSSFWTRYFGEFSDVVVIEAEGKKRQTTVGWCGTVTTDTMFSM